MHVNTLSNLEIRISARVVQAANGCLEWRGTRNTKGYGQLRVGGKLTLVHRVTWEIHNGPIPDGLCVLHKCDNRVCVNHDHLFLGTHEDNVRDMCAKGRQARGETHSQAKLTEQDVLAIRADPRPPRKIAEQYGVSSWTITAIQFGREWRHIGGELRSNLGKNHGNRLFGADNYSAKLTQSNVLAIRADPRKQIEIARHYGISPRQVGRIKRRKSWGHLGQQSEELVV